MGVLTLTEGIIPSDDSIEVNESPLPSIGLRDDFVTAGGKRVSVVGTGEALPAVATILEQP